MKHKKNATRIFSFLTTLFVAGSISNLDVKAFDETYFDTLNSQKMTSENFVNWTPFGPGNAGYSESVYLHPTDPNVLFNMPDMGNFYRSGDGGKTFTAINDVDISAEYNGINGVVSGSMDFSRQNADFGIGVAAGMSITHDRGLTWTKVTQSDMLGRIGAIAVDHNDDNIWYAGSGKMWDVKLNSATAAQPFGERNINPGFFWKTIDAGKTWTPLSNGLHPKAEYGDIVVSPNDNNIVFASSSYGLYKSVNGGEEFFKITAFEEETGEDTNIVRTIQSHYDNDTKVLTLIAVHQATYSINETIGSVESHGGIYKSTDDGVTWTNITGNLGINLAEIHDQLQVADIADSKKNYIRSWFYSTGRCMGRYFSGVVSNLSTVAPNLPTYFFQDYNKIAVDPRDPNRIYVAHNANHGTSMYIGDVWKTEDGGNSWTIVTRTGTGWSDISSYWDSLGQATDVNVTYHHFGDYYFDELFTTQGARDLDIGPTGDVFVMYRSLVKSTDDGAFWQQTDVDYADDGISMTGTGGSNLPGYEMYTDPRDPDLMYITSGENRIFKMTDDGNENADGDVYVKNLVDTPESATIMAIDPVDINKVYALTQRQHGKGTFIRSLDAGETWETLSNPLNPTAAQINPTTEQVSLIIDPNNTNNIYFTVPAVGVLDALPNAVQQYDDWIGVYKSTDGGYTWAKHIEGFTKGQAPYSMVFDPNDSNTLYGGTTMGKLLTTISNNDFDSLDNWTVVGEVTDINKVEALNSAAKISGNGVGIEQLVSELLPNTDYYLSSIVQGVAGETGYVYVKSEDGSLIGEQSFDNTVKETRGVKFTTGDGQTSVIIGGTKKEGEGAVFVNTFRLRSTGGLYVSKDAAKSWIEIKTIPEEITQINDLIIDKHTNKMYIGCGDRFSEAGRGGIWVSEDMGLTWNKIFESPIAGATVIDPNNSNRLMTSVRPTSSQPSGLNTGIYYTDNAGETWSKINNGIGNATKIGTMAFDLEEKDVLWATSSSGSFYKAYITKVVPEPERDVVAEALNAPAQTQTTQAPVSVETYTFAANEKNEFNVSNIDSVVMPGEILNAKGVSPTVLNFTVTPPGGLSDLSKIPAGSEVTIGFRIYPEYQVSSGAKTLTMTMTDTSKKNIEITQGNNSVEITTEVFPNTRFIELKFIMPEGNVDPETDFKFSASVSNASSSSSSSSSSIKGYSIDANASGEFNIQNPDSSIISADMVNAKGASPTVLSFKIDAGNLSNIPAGTEVTMGLKVYGEWVLSSGSPKTLTMTVADASKKNIKITQATASQQLTTESTTAMRYINLKFIMPESDVDPTTDFEFTATLK